MKNTNITNARITQLSNNGMTETQIYRYLGISLPAARLPELKAKIHAVLDGIEYGHQPGDDL